MWRYKPSFLHPRASPEHLPKHKQIQPCPPRHIQRWESSITPKIRHNIVLHNRIRRRKERGRERESTKKTTKRDEKDPTREKYPGWQPRHIDSKRRVWASRASWKEPPAGKWRLRASLNINLSHLGRVLTCEGNVIYIRKVHLGLANICRS